MSETLLQTKLYFPPLRPNVVPRPRLIERLNQGLETGNKLTLVSAPAGYGKTTLITDWINDRQSTNRGSFFTWLSLDEADNERPRFFNYLIAALQKVDPAIGANVPSILESGADVPIERLLTSLVNDIIIWGGDHNASSGKFENVAKQLVLVLDDYHMISEFDIHESLDFLIDHIPPGMHLVIISRTDPPMPVGRLRVQQALTEIREAHLRFTNSEVLSFLNDFMGLGITLEDARVLEKRTEGWIAGLQLAALSLRDRADKHQLILAYSGSHHHLIDYLAHEVLARQSESVQSFLMQTSLLEQFNAFLCDSVLGLVTFDHLTSDEKQKKYLNLDNMDDRETADIYFHRPSAISQSTLDYLEQANLFLVPLDNKREWYRYHHLFVDFLRERVSATQPEIIPNIFLRASQWYESRGLIEDAMTYALKGGHEIRAARLLDENAEAFIIVNAEIERVLRWANRLPEHVRAQFPRLCIYHAWALQFEFQLDLVEPTLALAEGYLAHPGSLPDGFSANLLLGHANAVRAYTALRKVELEQAITISLTTLKSLPRDDKKEVILLHGALTLLLGMAYLERGDDESAHQALRKALPMNQQAGNRYAALSCILQMTYLDYRHGALNQVDNATQKGLLWIEEWSKSREHHSRPARMVALFRLQRGMVQYERNELRLASGSLHQANEYLELVNSYLRLSVYASLVDLYHALGDDERAFETLRKLKTQSLKEDYSSSYFPVSAWIAERNLLLGHLNPDLKSLVAEAVHWAEISELRSNDSFHYEQEYEYRTFARVLIEKGEVDKAIFLLTRLMQSAENSERWGDLIVCLALLALAQQAQNKNDTALENLSRALKLAEPERYVRTFVDLGPKMRDLLKAAVRQGIATSYVSILIDTFPVQEAQNAPAPQTRQISISPSSSPIQLIEPLTERELQILRLMSAVYSNPQIAAELHLSVNTVKWYARQIYEKLGVTSRREAVGRARGLEILAQ